MHKSLLSIIGALPLLAAAAAHAQEQSVYVTRQDCKQLVEHHPDPGVTYQPGTDVHGRYVPPADLPGGSNNLALPDKITFDLKINPLAYAAPQPQAVPSGALSNTTATIGRVEVDLLSGAVKFNGQSLDGEQTRIVTEACRKAGYR